MAAPAPSSLFVRYASVWRHLSLRSDVDDIVHELLGRFSLEKIYAGGTAADRDAYSRLVIALLTQLSALFYVQRLTLPADSVHVGRYLGLLVSWEVALRAVEFVLQVVVDGREALWDCPRLRDKYLAEFLLGALRVLTLHPRAPSGQHQNQRAKDRRERFARIHKSLEQVFDSYPGTKSFLLLLCKEVTEQLHVDPDSLGLPQRLRYELPNIVSELYPLPPCLLPPYVSELVPQYDSPGSWLPAFLAMRDISHYVVGASIQYVVNQENRNVRLQSSSARSRNAILLALDNLRMPSHLSKMDLVASFSATFRIVLPDTLDLSQSDSPELAIEELELDALDSFCARLSERQIIHRVSDRAMTHSVQQIIKDVLLLDSPTGQRGGGRPGLYVMNCPECHFVGGTELRASNVALPLDPDDDEITLPLQSTCPECDETVTMAREVPLARRTWELLRVLEPDANTINVERHLPTSFYLNPQKSETGGFIGSGYSSVEQRPTVSSRSTFQGARLTIPDPEQTMEDLARTPSHPLFSPLSPTSLHPPDTSGTDNFRSDSSTYVDKQDKDTVPELTSPSRKDTALSPESRSLTNDLFRRKSEATTEKRSSKWRLPFTSSKKTVAAVSGDSSSLSSTVLENQRLEEINLSMLFGSSKSSGRGRAAKNISTTLSQSSSLGLFWAQLAIHIWDLGTSPPTPVRSISTESSCIQATIGKTHMAYIIGTRDQKLTLRIINVHQSSTPIVEYRMASSPWCRSIAIDKKENYVVVGFENSTVRFFKTTTMEQPREDRLHLGLHHDCSRCPSVDTLAFSHDGLALLASTRSAKTGIIQLYLWRFPFLKFQELTACRYHVPLHESEDNGLSSALFRTGPEGESGLICVTTWTQSGAPILVQSQGGHRSAIRSDVTARHGKLGNRIQCAAFSPTGTELAMVNDKGHLYQVSNLNSSPVDIKRLSTSKELTAKSNSFSMGYMTLGDEESIVLAWADSSKAIGWIKKIPVTRENMSGFETAGVVYVTSGGDMSALPIDINAPGSPVELAVNTPPVELAATEPATTPPSKLDPGGFTL